MTKKKLTLLPTTWPGWLSDDSPLPDPHSRGERAVQFVSRLKLYQGEKAGQPFPLTRYQERILRRVYGDTDIVTGRRKIRTVFILAGRGWGKSTFAAGLGCLHLGPERDPGAQVVVCATKEDETDHVFRVAAAMVEQSVRLSGMMNVTTGKNNRKIVHRESRSSFQAVSGAPQSGQAVSCFIADELWSWNDRKGRDTFSLVKTSMVKRSEPLTIIITMAGRGRRGLAWEYLEYARAVARGTIVDPSFLPILFEAPHDVDWTDEDVWRLFNPALDAGFLNIAEFREQAKLAAEIPFEREEFKRLFLSIWQDGHVNGFVDMEVWDEGGAPFSLMQVRHLPLYLGVDMSISEDLTSVTALWRDGEGEDARYYTRPFVFVPSENLRERGNRDRAAYGEWVESGLMAACDGAVIDHRDVEALIRRLCRLFDVRAIGFDRAYAGRLMKDLLDDGFPVIEVRQGSLTQVPAVDRLERAILSRRLIHGGNQPLRWALENVAVEIRAGGKMLKKRDRTSRIDPVAGLWMAFHVEMNAPPPRIALYGPDVEGILSISLN